MQILIQFNLKLKRILHFKGYNVKNPHSPFKREKSTTSLRNCKDAPLRLEMASRNSMEGLETVGYPISA